MPGRVVYYVADHWPYMPDTHETYWRDEAGGRLRKHLKRLVAPLPLRMVAEDRRRFALAFANVLCVSNAIREALAAEAHIPRDNLRVVYNGIDPAAFPYRERSVALDGDRLRLLYAGSLFPHKGVHTAVEAMAVLARAGCLRDTTLAIVGSGRPDYEEHLATLVQAQGLLDHVHFLGRVSREEMPALLDRFDVLVFPSAWPEPLARMTQEAMASGLAVVGTTTGGTGEILEEGVTGLTFAPGDAAMLADRILELRGDSALFRRLTRNARAVVEAKFDIRRMFDEIEASLAAAAGAPAAEAPAAEEVAL